MVNSDLYSEMQSNGFDYPPAHVSVNVFVRFAGIGKKKSNRAGYAIQSETGLVTYGDFATGEQFVYRPEGSKPMTKEEKRELSRRIADGRAKAEQEELEKHIRASKEVNQIWQTQTEEILFSHDYLLAKSSGIHGIRVVNKGKYRTALMIPIIGTKPPFVGVMQSAQFIFPDGQKWFYEGGKRAEGYWEIKWIEGAPIVIAEGYSTGSTLAKHYTPDCSVLIAFTAGNLLEVAKAFRVANPDAEIIIAGDNDHMTKKKTGFNTGKEKAIQAAQAVNGLISIPEFAADEDGSDWNDRYLFDLKQ